MRRLVLSAGVEPRTRLPPAADARVGTRYSCTARRRRDCATRVDVPCPCCTAARTTCLAPNRADSPSIQNFFRAEVSLRAGREWPHCPVSVAHVPERVRLVPPGVGPRDGPRYPPGGGRPMS